MKCPKCNHEPTMTEMKVNPGTCPSCGVIYEKYIQALKRQALLARQQNKPAAEVVTGAAPVAGNQPQQVVITDIRMNFISMVIFMVKWAFAAIPAMIIIFLIVGMMGALFTGVVAGFVGGGSKSSASPSSHISQPSAESSTKQSPDSPLISGYLVDKGFDDDRLQPMNTMEIEFENHSGKNVVAFEGIVVLKDLLGNTITKTRITENNPSWSGDSYIWSGGTKYNRFDKDDYDLKNTPLASLRMTFDLKKILYSDGQALEF